MENAGVLVSLTCETETNYQSGKQQLNPHSNQYPSHTVLKIQMVCLMFGCANPYNKHVFNKDLWGQKRYCLRQGRRKSSWKRRSFLSLFFWMLFWCVSSNGKRPCLRCGWWCIKNGSVRGIGVHTFWPFCWQYYWRWSRCILPSAITLEQKQEQGQGPFNKHKTGRHFKGGKKWSRARRVFRTHLWHYNKL